MIRLVDARADIREQGSRDDALATLPWRSYRSHRWGNGLPASDPAARWFDRELVAPDGAVVVTGLDVGELAADGRLQRMAGFFGDLARAGGRRRPSVRRREGYGRADRQ